MEALWFAIVAGMLNSAGPTVSGAESPSPFPSSGASEMRMPMAYQMGSPLRNARK